MPNGKNKILKNIGEKVNRAGRPAGSPNKATKFCRDLVQGFLDNGADKFQQEFNSLKGKEYCNVYTELMEYCAPKLARTELVTDQDNGIKVVINRADQPASK